MTDPRPHTPDPPPEEERPIGHGDVAGSTQQPISPTRQGMNLRQRASENPGTFGLIGLTLSVFVLQLLSTQLFGVDLVLFFGAKEKSLIAAGQWWRLITPLLIHVGIMHFFVNMYSLYIIGPGVERFFGTLRFLTVYVLAGVGGVLLSLLFSEGRSVGASGAIFGLLGAYGAFLYMHRKTFGKVGSAQLRTIIFVAIINLAIGLSPGIDNWGHLGGLITGALLTYMFGPVYKYEYDESGQAHLVDERPWSTVRRSMGLLGLALIGLSLIAVYV